LAQKIQLLALMEQQKATADKMIENLNNELRSLQRIHELLKVEHANKIELLNADINKLKG
jgi:uncharacterized lipoprotein YehR (DUF1307 family)